MIASACAAGTFGIFDGRIAVIFENHPDIGQITGRRVGSLTARTAMPAAALFSPSDLLGNLAQYPKPFPI